MDGSVEGDRNVLDAAGGTEPTDEGDVAKSAPYDAQLVLPPSTRPPVRPATVLLSMDDFLCPICRDLVFKPVVNACGHVFCFWCVHRAMTPYSESRCPMCRRAFAHFPGVCWLLHRFLSSAFPADYRARARDVAEEERAMGTFSPSAPPALSAPSAPSLPEAEAEPTSRAGARMRDPAQEKTVEGRVGKERGDGRAGEGRGKPLSAKEGTFLAYWQQQFSCGVCGLLLLHPVVLNCGH
ncbi:unnamed protein product, partial [Closterium sp. Naga37s-1]